MKIKITLSLLVFSIFSLGYLIFKYSKTNIYEGEIIKKFPVEEVKHRYRSGGYNRTSYRTERIMVIRIKSENLDITRNMSIEAYYNLNIGDKSYFEFTDSDLNKENKYLNLMLIINLVSSFLIAFYFSILCIDDYLKDK